MSTGIPMSLMNLVYKFPPNFKYEKNIVYNFIYYKVIPANIVITIPGPEYVCRQK